MPISKNWSRASIPHVKKHAPSKSGIYELKSFGELVYIGSSENIQHRLLEHLNSRDPNYYRFQTGDFLSSYKRMEREHYDRFVEKYGRSPRWNDRRP
jgi:excinuclease UvrABC nuclease subunit